MALFAVGTLWAQDMNSVTNAYNDAAKAYSAKDYATAATGFEQAIDQGIDLEEASTIVATAKTYLPKCYYFMGARAAQQNDFDTAMNHFKKSAELAELYGDAAQMGKSKSMIAKIYMVQGGNAFNNKDYATAGEIFAQGYAADPKNAQMANLLATCYCETDRYPEGMAILGKVAANPNPKYAEEVAEARRLMTLYTNNEVAKLQIDKQYDEIIAMADRLLESDPDNAILNKVRVQAYSDKKDYDKVIELAEAAASVQQEPDDASTLYYLLGLAYNVKEMKPQAVEALKKVTAGPSVEAAKAALAELNK